MPSKPHRPRDPNQLAHQIMLEATGQADKPAELPDTRNPAAVAMSKLGASKGGHTRAAALSATRRRAIAKKAIRGAVEAHQETRGIRLANPHC